jgi:nicotinate-nucleotide adenylyltransferase
VVANHAHDRIALFGGSFDPPHCGHLAIAQAAADTFRLDLVLFSPTGRQPLKHDHASASFNDRFTMVRLACEDDPRFAASDIDAPHPDGSPNYTVDALEELRRRSPSAELFAISGADSFLTLNQWHEPDRLLELADWIVVSRPGSSLQDLAPLHLSSAQQAKVHFLTTVHEDISSTALRKRLGAGEDCTGLMPPPVAGYITRYGLYRHQPATAAN